MSTAWLHYSLTHAHPWPLLVHDPPGFIQHEVPTCCADATKAPVDVGADADAGADPAHPRANTSLSAREIAVKDDEAEKRKLPPPAI